MSVFVYQSFELKQDKFFEAVDNLKEMQKYRNENYDHKVEILSPISGNDYIYAFLSTYEGMAEMELQNKKMFDDEKYLKLVQDFFVEHVVQGTMHTQMFRSLTVQK